MLQSSNNTKESNGKTFLGVYLLLYINMKKEIILTIFISIGAYELYKLYMWIIQERKKHRKKKLPNEVVAEEQQHQDQCLLRYRDRCIHSIHTKETSAKDNENKCNNYPTNTSPDSPYVGVKDRFTFDVVYNVAIVLAMLGLVYIYFN
jgi:hypothetical protein